MTSWKDAAIASRCERATFSLTGEDDVECIERVKTFKYLGRILDRSVDDWPAVLRNVREACRVWSRLGKLLRREGAEPRVSAMFYRTVVQAVLLFGAETWVLSEAMSRKLEGVNMGFLRQIMGQRAVRRKERNWRQVAAEKVLEKAGTHSLGAYTDRRQTTVAEWVELRPILEVCDRETSYKGGGRCREPWWRQTADRKYLSARLKEIPEAARERRWKSGRHGGGRNRQGRRVVRGWGRD